MHIKFTSLICMIFLSTKNVYGSDTIESKPSPLVHKNFSIEQNFSFYKADAVNIQFFINNLPLDSSTSFDISDDSINAKEYFKEENVGNFANFLQNNANSKIFFEKLAEVAEKFLSSVEKSFLNFENPSKKNEDIEDKHSKNEMSNVADEENNSKTSKNNINGDLSEDAISTIV
ncbi:hypothetical protein H311_01963 [Anncaliia algerae PRA109]|nr:hypothetical protein H311_01963 [Anncaliia algerae PRA109]